MPLPKLPNQPKRRSKGLQTRDLRKKHCFTMLMRNEMMSDFNPPEYAKNGPFVIVRIHHGGDVTQRGKHQYIGGRYDYSGGQSTGKGTADEVVDCSHVKQLWELCKLEYEPLWINGGGHCNLELYPEFIKHLKKFVLSLGKSKPAVNGSSVTTASVNPEDKNKSAESSTTDTFDLQPDLPEISRNSLDSRIDKTKKATKPENPE